MRVQSEDVEWHKRGGEWQDIVQRYMDAYGAGRQQILTDDENVCLPWLRALSHLFFFVSNVRHSWTRTALAIDDLKEAEAVVAQQARED